MNNFSKILGALFCCLLLTGCSQYFVSTTPGGEYFGAYNLKDFTHADTVVYKKNSDLVCTGVIFLNSPTRSITLKNENTDATMKAGCSDGTILNITWELSKKTFKNGKGKGYDQLGREYSFQTVSKSEYNEVSNNKKPIFAKGNSYLKY